MKNLSLLRATYLRTSVCLLAVLVFMACGDAGTDETASSETPNAGGKADDLDQSAAEECPSGVWDGDVATQSSLRAAKYCAQINGNIEIEMTSGLTEITFPLLEQINGHVYIGNVSDLTHVSIPLLTRVSGYIFIADNNALTSISMSALTTVNENVDIRFNPVLTDVAMPLLTSVGGYVYVGYNDALSNDFSTCDLGTYSNECPAIIIVGCDSDITTEAALLAAKDCVTIDGNIHIEDVNDITHVEFPVLKQVNGNVEFHSVRDLISISMPVLDIVTGDLWSENNDNLENITLPVLTTLNGKFVFHDNAKITTITLPALTTVSGYAFSIQFNDILTRIFMPALVKVFEYNDGGIFIRFNYVLQDIDFPVLQTVGELWIHYNRELKKIIFPSIVKIGADFEIYDNTPLTDIDLPVLTTIDGSLVLENHYELVRLNMPSLTSVGDFIDIQGNANLPNCNLGARYSNRYCPQPEIPSSNTPDITTTEPEITTVWEAPGSNGPGAFVDFETELLPEGDYIVTLSVAISDPSIGNLNLYTRNGSPPDLSYYDCRPYLDSGNDEVCHISIESPTKIHMMVDNLVALEFIGSPDVDPLSYHLRLESID